MMVHFAKLSTFSKKVVLSFRLVCLSFILFHSGDNYLKKTLLLTDLLHGNTQLDGIRRIDHFADARRISEERSKIRPVSLPASAYLRTATVPGRSERFQCLLVCLFP